MATTTFPQHTFSQKRNDGLVSVASMKPSLCLLTGHVLSPEALFLHCLGLSVFYSAHVSNYLIFFPVLSFLQRFQTVGGELFTAC